MAEKNTICSFYDFDSLNWSNKGCSKNLENSGWYYYNTSSTKITIYSLYIIFKKCISTCALRRLFRVMWPSLTVTFFYFSACECNHLTHFGLLLRPPTEDTGTHHAVPLRLITICGCSISAFALILTAGFLIYRGKINGWVMIRSSLCIYSL